jgi:hypothetical protein
MAGGGGTRLWPLSTEDCPKQFLKLISDKSLLRETYDRVRPATDDIYVATSGRHVSRVREELPEVPPGSDPGRAFATQLRSSDPLRRPSVRRGGGSRDGMRALGSDRRGRGGVPARASPPPRPPPTAGRWRSSRSRRSDPTPTSGTWSYRAGGGRRNRGPPLHRKAGARGGGGVRARGLLLERRHLRLPPVAPAWPRLAAWRGISWHP